MSRIISMKILDIGYKEMLIQHSTRTGACLVFFNFLWLNLAVVWALFPSLMLLNPVQIPKVNRPLKSIFSEEFRCSDDPPYVISPGSVMKFQVRLCPLEKAAYLKIGTK